MPNRLQMSFALAECTPEKGMPFGRFSTNRMVSEGVHSPIYARLMLMADADGLAGILILDQNRVRRLAATELRAALAAGCGGDVNRFMVAATHSHNSSMDTPWRPDDPGFSRLDLQCEIVKRLAADAVRRLAPARLRVARADLPGWAWNRRPICRAPDGRQQVGTHGPRFGDDLLGMEGPDASALHAMVAEDDSGRVLGGVVNFPCHPTTMYSVPLFSADYPGAVVDEMQRRLGGTFLFLTDAAGDQSPASAIQGRAREAGPEFCARMGQALADAAVTALDHADTLPTPQLRCASTILRLPRRESTQEQIEAARAHITAVDRGERPTDVPLRLYGYQWHMKGGNPAMDDWLAHEVIGMWEQRRRTEARAILEEVELQAIRLGDLAFTSFPCELFHSFAVELRRQYPKRYVFIAEQANGHCGYVPPESSFDRGGFECCLGMHSRLIPVAGRMMTDAVARLLSDLTD